MKYNSRFFLLVFFFYAYSTLAQNKEVLKVPWSGDNPLTTADFKIKAPDHATERKLKNGKKHSTLEGYIFSGFDFVIEQKGNTLRLNVQAYMEPGQSWLRDTSSISTLEHEQAHFDITEIYARKLRKELLSVKSANEAKKVYQKMFKLLEKEQKAFDADQYGEDVVTPEWKSKIEQELKNLREFSDPQVIVYLK